MQNIHSTDMRLTIAKRREWSHLDRLQVLERSTLEPDQSVFLTGYNGGYESFATARSRYNSQLIKIYSVGSDTWVEGGYVRARVVKRDIGCINGAVHQIDAVFGIPTRDLPYTIFCDDGLVSTWKELEKTGLQNYLRDTKLVKNQACPSSANARAGAAVPNTGSGTSWGNSQPSSSSSADLDRDLCGHGVHRCQFTFFVPSGPAIDNFARTSIGRTIMSQPKRWRWVCGNVNNELDIFVPKDKIR
ncbi:fasciclin-1 [Elysia marginata]|uniref:Fasciclin-1 n=1 Tax=Elysia marginata TaxID=1093978 RepID=A0AAV4EWR1_9GAST|nr:fasciclin-1 [Elysia marginata]